MKVRACVFFILPVAFILLGNVYLQGADDIATPIDWSEVTTYVWVDVPYVVSETDLKEAWVAKALNVQTNHIPSHCRSDEVDPPPSGAPHVMNHVHHEKDFGDADFPTVAEANRFWDWRFGIVSYDPDKTTRVSNATTLHNCHSYAFNEQADGGKYDYWCSQQNIAHADDFVKRGSIYDVEEGDLLRYLNDLGATVHSSIVVTVDDGHPTLLRWKYEYSGVYDYAPPPGYRFDQPRNICFDVSKTIASQTGTWDGASLPLRGVWRDD